MAINNTRKLCYRKDDRAMRPMYACTEKFPDSLTAPAPTIPKKFHGLLVRSMYLQNFKSVLLTVS